MGFYLLPVPRIETFVLPSVVERATSKPTPICIHLSLYEYKTPYIAQCAIPIKEFEIYHIPRASTVAKFMTTPESCEVSIRQEQASSKRLYIMSRYQAPPAILLSIKVSKRRHSVHRYGVSESGIACKGNEKIDYSYLFQGLFFSS